MATTKRTVRRGRPQKNPEVATQQTEVPSVEQNAPQASLDAQKNSTNNTLAPVPKDQRKRLRRTDPRNVNQSYFHVEQKYKHDGFHQAWIWEDDVPRRMEEGWAPVRGIQPRVANIRSDGRRVVLMDIPQEYRDEDNQAYIQRVRAKIDGIVNTGSDNPSEGRQLTGTTKIHYSA